MYYEPTLYDFEPMMMTYVGEVSQKTERAKRLSVSRL